MNSLPASFDFDVAHAVGGLQQVVQAALVAVEQRVDQLVLGRIVVVHMGILVRRLILEDVARSLNCDLLVLRLENKTQLLRLLVHSSKMLIATKMVLLLVSQTVLIQVLL